MLLTSVRVSPWRLLWSLSSAARVTRISSPSWATAMSGGSSRLSVPLGPLTVMRRPSMAMSTPAGTGTGRRPIRLIDSPHVRQDLAAELGLVGLGAGHDPVRGADDDDAQTAQDPRDLRLARIHAQARLADPLEARDDRHLAVDVLHVQPEDGAGTFLLLAPVRDEALLREDASDLALGPGGRHDHVHVTCACRIPAPREHVRDRIGDVHLLLPARLGHAGQLARERSLAEADPA